MKIAKHLGWVQVSANVANVKALQARGPISVQVSDSIDIEAKIVSLARGDVLANEELMTIGTGKVFVSAKDYDTDVQIRT